MAAVAKGKKKTRNRFVGAFFRWLVSNGLNFFYRIKVSGKHNVPETGPFILIGNHEHVFDPLVIQMHVKPWIYWVAKSELYKIPLIGAILRAIGTVPFQREEMDVAALRKIVSIVKNDEVVGIFPQGRRVEPEERDEVLPKAATAHLARRFQVPVLPVAIANGFHLFGKMRPHIIFGEPFMVEKDGDDMEIAIDMLKRVYRLMGQTYLPKREEEQA